MLRVMAASADQAAKGKSDTDYIGIASAVSFAEGVLELCLLCECGALDILPKLALNVNVFLEFSVKTIG